MDFLKKRDKDNSETYSATDLSSKMKLCDDRINFYLYIIKELHKFINKFVFDFKEIDAGKIKKQINELENIFISQERPIRLEHVFQNYKNIVSAYITDMKEYSGAKEGEYKSIIKILTKGISVINNDAREFNSNMMDHTSALEEINRLDDIKRIKDGLTSGISQIENAVKEKAKKDVNSLKMLSKKVDVLSDDLKKAEAASMTDKLTGAYNRLAFDMYMEDLTNTLSSKLSSVSVMMIDIDNFKSVNDTYGHLIGDRVIIDTVQKCKRFLRENDFVARFGGEEFVVVLEGVTLKIAQRKAEKICKEIACLDFVIDSGESNKSLSYTVSIGISEFREGDTALTIIDRADKALYKAKTTGKNQAINEKEM